MNRCITFILFLVLLLLTGCNIGGTTGTPPDYSINHPVIITDESENVFTAYQINYGNGDRRTYVQRLGKHGEKLWENHGFELTSDIGGFLGNGEYAFSTLIADNEGNIIVVYPSGYGVEIIKLNTHGESMFPPVKIYANTKVKRSLKVIDNNYGGVIIAWISDNASINITNTDIDGTEIWRKTLSTPNIDQFDMINDIYGSTFILWKDNPPYSEGRLFLEKVDSTGTIWTGTNLLISDVNTEGSIVDRITSDGDGGAIVVWVANQKLFVQHIDMDGQLLWNEGLVLANTHSDPRIIRNNSGYLIFWRDGKSIRIQSIDSNGNTLWKDGSIVQTVISEKRQVYFYPTNGDDLDVVAFVWNCTEKDIQVLRMQCLDSSGNKLWDNEGIVVSSTPVYWAGYASPARITPDGNGGFFISWVSGKHIQSETSSYIQRISANGSILWGEEGIRLDE